LSERDPEMVDHALSPLLAALNVKCFALSRRNRHNGGMGTRGRYSIMLFRAGGEGSGIEAMIDSDDRLDVARELYEREIMKRPGRLVMLRDRRHVLARSDRPETKPI
jgi:hypothetical protein